MKHEALKDKCRKAFGVRIPMAAKERWATFLREERTEFTFRYDWIRDPRFYTWVHENSEHLEVRDGAEWFGVYICKPDGEAVNDYVS